MAPDRRSVLKSIGAAGAVSVLTVGSAFANEDCYEVVDDYSFQELSNLNTSGAVSAPPLPPDLYYYTDSFIPDNKAFEGSEFEETRIYVTGTWTPAGVAAPGPIPSSLTQTTKQVWIQRQTLAGNWETIAYNDGPSGIELEAVNGETWKGTEPLADGEAQNSVIVEGGATYRLLVVLYLDQAPIVEFNYDVEFQAFDPVCLNESSE